MYRTDRNLLDIWKLLKSLSIKHLVLTEVWITELQYDR